MMAREREPLYIFDPFDNLLAVTTAYQEAFFEEVINGHKTLEIIIHADHEDAEYINEDNQVVFRDLDGRFRLFVIKEIEDEDGEKTVRLATCFPGMDELNDEPLEDVRAYNTTARDALTKALANTRWQPGDVAELGINSTNFYYQSVLSAIWKIIEAWGGELVDRVEIDENRITGRYIDIVYRLGADTGKIFEIGKDIQNIKRTVRSYPVTALYGRGNGQEIIDEEGQTTGGYTRKITFADVSWSKAAGDPADKPLGQEWVGDEEAREKYGIPDPATGTRRHRFGFYDADEDDPIQLLRKTWDALQRMKEPEVSFDMSVATFEGISGYEHERVRLGDTGTAIDRRLKPEIVVEARVVRMRYDLGDPSNGEITLGNYIDLFESDRKLQEDVKKLKDRTGVWDRVQEPIDDTDFPDTPPPVPSNVEVNGLFKTIMLSWDYDPSSYIAAYEVYASQVQGFSPDPSNLVFRGKAGGFAFPADTNQTWYFRLRAVNTHGTPSAYTDEYSASTARIQDIDIAIGAINADKLRDLSITAAKLAQGTITGDKIASAAIQTAHIADAAVGNAAIQNAAITNAKIANAAVETAHIKDLAVTNAKIADLAVDSAKIANLAVTNAKIADLHGSKIHAGSITADKLSVGTLSAISANLGTVTAGSITSNTTINVTTDLYVGNNIYIGDYLSYTTKTIWFNNQAYIRFPVYRDQEGLLLQHPSGVVYISNYASIDTKYDQTRWRHSQYDYIRQANGTTGGVQFFMNGSVMYEFRSYETPHLSIAFGHISLKALYGTLEQLQIRNRYDTSYRDIAASAFIQASSKRFKRGIRPFTARALDIVNRNQVFEFEYKTIPKRQIGFVYERATAELKDDEGGVSLNRQIAILWKAVQELHEMVKRGEQVG